MPTAAQVKAVERLVHETVAAVDALVPGQINALMPALKQAHAELQSDLQDWLEKHPDGGAKFTAFHKKQALASLEATFERIAELHPAMAHSLGLARKETGGLAASNLGLEVQRLSSIFDGGMITIPQIDTAAIIAQGNKLLFKRHENSAKRYAAGIGDDIKLRMSVSLAKGDTFEQMVQRLRGSRQFRQAVADSDPSALSHGVADEMFHRWRHWADRLVRTENMHAYNVQHDLSIKHVNAQRHEDDDEYLRRWDATADNVTCPFCRELDRTLATIDGEFKGGIKSPPRHPYCRCVVLAWLARWGHFKGEVPARAHDGTDIEPAPDKPKAPPVVHDVRDADRRAQASADAKKAAAEDLASFEQHKQKQSGMAAQIAAAKAKQAKLLAEHKAKLEAIKAAKEKAEAELLAKQQAEAQAKAAAEAAAKKAAEEAAAKAAAIAKANAEHFAKQAKMQAEYEAKLAAEKAALEAAKQAKAAADAAAQLAQKQAADQAAKQAKAAAAKAKKIAKLEATAAPFNPDTSGTLGFIPGGKAKGKAKLLNKPGMVQIDADTIVGHGYTVKWNSASGAWATQSGPTAKGWYFNYSQNKWEQKGAPVPTSLPPPSAKPVAAPPPMPKQLDPKRSGVVDYAADKPATYGGFHGRAFVQDADAIEGGSVRVVKVAGTIGDYYEAVFKLTAPYGSKAQTYGQTSSSQFTFRARKHLKSGLKDTGTEETQSCKARMHKGAGHTLEVGGSGALTNQVRIRANSLEELNAAMDQLSHHVGADLRKPPTKEDLELQAKARIAAKFDPKTFGASMNGVTDPQRQREVIENVFEAQARKHPVMRDAVKDAEIREVYPGHATLYSETLGKHMAKVWGSLYHDGSPPADIAAKIVGETGLMSSAKRYHSGVFTTGMSTSTDFGTGGADGVFMRVHRGEPTDAGGRFRAVLDTEKVMGRMDWWSFNYDNYGRAGYGNYGERWSVADQHANPYPGSTNEVMATHGVPPSAIKKFICSTPGYRNSVLDELRKQGITEINGQPIEKIVVNEH